MAQERNMAKKASQILVLVGPKSMALEKRRFGNLVVPSGHFAHHGLIVFQALITQALYIMI